MDQIERWTNVDDFKIVRPKEPEAASPMPRSIGRFDGHACSVGSKEEVKYCNESSR